MQSVAISGTQWVSTLMGLSRHAISGHQWPSEVIRGHQRMSTLMGITGSDCFEKITRPLRKGGLVSCTTT